MSDLTVEQVWILQQGGDLPLCTFKGDRVTKISHTRRRRYPFDVHTKTPAATCKWSLEGWVALTREEAS